MAEVLSLFPDANEPQYGPDPAASSPSLFPDQNLQRTVKDGLATPSGQAERVLRMQYRTGLPSGVIERNLDEVEAKSAEQNFDAEKFRAENPRVAGWLAEDKNRAALAKNDVGNLSTLEKIFNAFGTGFSKVSNQEDIADLVRLDRTGQAMTPDQQAKLGSLKKVREQFGKNEAAYGASEWTAGQFGYAARQLMSSGFVGARGALYGATAGAAAGSLLPGVGTTAGAAAGGIAGGLTASAMYTYDMEANSAYEDLTAMRDVEGNPIQKDIARFAANTVGSINGVIELGSDLVLGKIIKVVPGVDWAMGKLGRDQAKQFVTQRVGEALANPTRRAAMMAALGKMSGMGITEGLEEFFQSLVGSWVGREGAQAASGQVFKPDSAIADIKEAAGEMGAAAVGSFLTGGLVVAPGMPRQFRQIRQAQQEQQFFEALGETVTNSEVQKKLPAAMGDLVANLKQDGPIQNVYINVTNWDAAFQGEGQQAATKVFGSPDQYLEAKALGADLVIPVEDYASKIAATPIHQQLIGDLRLHQGSISANEATWLQGKLDAIVAEHVAAADQKFQADAPARQVYQHIYDQLTPMMGESEAARNALLESSKYAAAAEQLKTDAWTLYSERPMNIKRDILATPGQDVVAQSAAESDLLEPFGKSRSIGEERLLSDSGDVKAYESTYVSSTSGRSIRYVKHDADGNPIGVLQFRTLGPRSKKAVIQNIFTVEGSRRTGVASGLLRRAQEDFDIKHSKDLTKDGRSFKAADGVYYQVEQPQVLYQPVSTRVPTALPRGKNPVTVENPLSERLQIGLDAFKAVPDAFASAVKLLTSYVNWHPDPKLRGADARAERFIQEVVSNLLWLHDQVPEEIRVRSKLWYDGANVIANTFASKYGISLAQSSAVIAVNSPQTDWFTNVSRAERILDIWTNQQDFAWSNEMGAVAKQIFGKEQYLPDLANITGKTLADLTGDTIGQAMWIRAFDEAHDNRSYREVSPEGAFMGYVQTMKGEDQRMPWASLSMTQKSIEVLQNGSMENISLRLGNEHKVRSFYNNIFAPNDPVGDVTIDTHAVAAGLLRALSGSSIEVAHNLGAGVSNNLKGISGTYGIYAEAYRRAAASRGLLPRELQSITWEAIRGMYTDVFKRSAKANQVEQAWKDYRAGKMTEAQVRSKIHDIAGGINEPTWWQSDRAAPSQTWSSTYGGELSEFRLAGRPSETGADGAPGAGRTGARAGEPSQELTWEWEGGNALFQPAGVTPDTLYQGQAQTETPEFKRWFGDSKVVDAQGKPLVVYHGTVYDNEGEFSPDAGISYFSPDKSFASRWAQSRAQGRPQGAPHVLPVYLSIQKLFDFRNPAHRKLAETWVKANAEDYPHSWRTEKDLRDQIKRGYFGALEDPEMSAVMLDNGFDGFIVREADNSDTFNYGVFSPTQIKSAIGNTGAFDPNDPDILHQSSPVFYSALAKEIGALNIKSAPAKGWLDSLNGLLSKGRVKANEIKWSGLEEWLAIKADGDPAALQRLADAEQAQADYFKQFDNQKSWERGPFNEGASPYSGQSATTRERLLRDINDAKTAIEKSKKITKEQVQAYLKANGVRVEEVRLGDSSVDVARIKYLRGLPEDQVRREIANAGIELFQGQAGPRGMFSRGTNTVTMLRSADPSTFQHESAHAYLENLRLWVQRPEATGQMKNDWATIAKWAGFDPNLPADQLIPVDAHERWARGWEAYLMEGKSPSVELQGAFARMKDWLVRIYKTVLALDVELNPEIRAVMDRTVASVDQIARAREMSGATGESILAADWMTAAERAAYGKLRAEALEEAENDIRTRLMNELVRERTDFWKAEKAQVKAEVEAEVNSQPVYIALSALQTGKLPDGRDVPGMTEPMKLSRDAIVAQYGEGYLKTLPKPFVFQMDGGLHPDVAAELFGFKNGGELLAAIQNAPAKKTTVDLEVDARMMERHGDLMNDGSLAERAAEAVANEKQMAVYYREMQILQRQGAAGNLIPLDRLLSTAKAVISAKKIADLSPSYYEASAAKAGRDAIRALIGNEPNFTRKLNAAFEARQRQILNLALFKEAAAQKRNYDRAMRSWKVLRRADAKLAKGRNMDLVNTARAILANYGVGASDRTPGSYMEAMATYDPQTYQDLKPLVDLVTSERKPMRQLTVDEFSMVKDAIDGLWHLARTANQMLIDGRRVDKEEVKAALQSRLDEFGRPAVRRGYEHAVTDQEKRGTMLLGIRAAMRRVESWVDAMDGGDFKGAFRTYIWQPISEAATHYREQRRVVLEKYLGLVKGIEKSITIDKISAPEIGYEFGANGSGRAELLGAMLHTGNESNLYKLLIGRGWGTLRDDGTLDTSRWDAFVARMQSEGKLGQAEYDFLQSVWNLLEELKAPAQLAHREIYGYYFNEVTAKPFLTPYGEYKGGYFPAMTDPWVVDEAALREDKAALESQQNSFMFPTTGRGFTKSRAEGYAKPLMLDMRLIPQHIDKVLKFTFIEPRVKEVGRLMIDKEFRDSMAAVDPTVIGEMVMPWLQRAATQAVETPATGRVGRQMDSFWRVLRSRTGAQIMVMNVTNTIQQFTGTALAATKVAPSYLAEALWQYVRSPTQTGQDIAEKSEFMRNRVTTAVFEIQKEIDDIMLNPSKYEQARSFATKHGYFLQSGAQNMVDIIAWQGAYNEAVAGGIDEQQAIRQADSAVRLTQGTFAAEDISRFETGAPLMRMFTMFYTYFNMQANLLGTEFTKAAEKGGFAGGARMFYVYLFGFMLPAVLSEAINQLMSGEAWKDKDKDDLWLLKTIMDIFFMGQIRTGLAMTGPVGQVAITAINQWNDKWYDDRMSTSPVIGMLEGVARAPYSIYKAVVKEQGSKRAIKDTLTAIGLATGMPIGWLGRPLGYLADMNEGKEQPANAIDMTRGLISGRTAK